MRPDEADKALRTGENVRAVWAYSHDRSETRAVGKVISWTDRPTVTIETEDGERVHWIMDLVDPASTGTEG